MTVVMLQFFELLVVEIIFGGWRSQKQAPILQPRNRRTIDFQQPALCQFFENEVAQLQSVQESGLSSFATLQIALPFRSSPFRLLAARDPRSHLFSIKQPPPLLSPFLLFSVRLATPICRTPSHNSQHHQSNTFTLTRHHDWT